MFLLGSRQPKSSPVQLCCASLFSVTSLRSLQGPAAYRHQRAGRLDRRRHRGAPFPPGAADSGMRPGQLRDRRGGKVLPSDPPGERRGQLPTQRDRHVKTRAFCSQTASSRRITGDQRAHGWALWDGVSSCDLIHLHPFC